MSLPTVLPPPFHLSPLRPSHPNPSHLIPHLYKVLSPGLLYKRSAQADNPGDPNETRTFKDALGAKSDGEWERKFLASQRRWLVCKTFCKLCRFSWWLFVPVLIMVSFEDGPSVVDCRLHGGCAVIAWWY